MLEHRRQQILKSNSWKAYGLFICQVDVCCILLQILGNWREPDRQWSKQGLTPNTHINQMHIFLAHTCKDANTYTLSSRQQGPVSNHDRAWMCSMVRANDLRHMSSPCGFKTKHCQESSSLAGQPALCSAVLGMRRAIQSQVQDETHHLPFTSFCSLPLQTAVDSVCAAPIWAAVADLPARLKRGPQHPGDWVRSHYPLWVKLCGGPGTVE